MQVDTIEEKFQNFLEMYMEDRKKIMRIAISTQSLLGVSNNQRQIETGSS